MGGGGGGGGGGGAIYSYVYLPMIQTSFASTNKDL